MTPKQRSIVAAFGALIYALFGVRILSSSIPSVWIAARDYAATASGGVGAVAFAVDVIVLPYVLLAMASIVANRMLAAWARGSGGNIKVLHQTQRWSIVLAFVVAIASVVGFNVGGGPLPFVLLPLGGVMWGFLFVLTGVLLGTYALRTSRA
jgi:hypothetical protein